jgi:hypothetical protein
VVSTLSRTWIMSSTCGLSNLFAVCAGAWSVIASSSFLGVLMTLLLDA